MSAGAPLVTHKHATDNIQPLRIVHLSASAKAKNGRG
jgi:hypothetical protein